MGIDIQRKCFFAAIIATLAIVVDQKPAQASNNADQRLLIFDNTADCCVDQLNEATPVQESSEYDSYFQGSLEQALNMARTSGRQVLLEFYAPWSYKSRWMHDLLAKNDNVIRILDDNYIVVLADVQQPSGASLASSYGINSYPTLVMFSKYGNPNMVINSTMEADELAEVLQESIRSKDAGAYGSTLRSKSMTIDELTKLVNKYGPDDTMVREAMRVFVSDMSVAKFAQAENLVLLNDHDFMFYGSPVYDYVVNNRKRLSIIMGDEQINTALLAAVEPTMMQMAVGMQPFDSIIMNNIANMELGGRLSLWTDMINARNQDNPLMYVSAVRDLVADPSVDKYLFSVILSLDMVADSANPSKVASQNAVKLVGQVSRSTVSPSKQILLNRLRNKLKSK